MRPTNSCGMTIFASEPAAGTMARFARWTPMVKPPKGAEDAPRSLDRRRLLGVGAAFGAGAAAAKTIGGAGVPWTPNEVSFPQAANSGGGYVFFNPAEAAFV